MQATTQARHIKYLALAHEGKLLADHLNWDKDSASTEKYDEVLRNIFGSPGWHAVRESGRNKLELKSASNIYCMEIDAQGRVFAVVVTSAYPIRHIFSSSSSSAHTQPRLMWEFAAHVTRNYPHESVASPPGGLKRSLKPFLRDLSTKFDDLDALDRLAMVTGKLDNLRSTMASNLSAADERQSLLEGVDRRGRDMEGNARRVFQRGASLGHRRRCCFCCYCPCSWVSAFVLSFLVFVIVAAVILSLNYTKFHWWR